jgi:CHAD domain-containing protein
MDEHLAQLAMKPFASDRLKNLLERVESEWQKCAAKADADAVHDFRVSLRRFGEALRMFKELMPRPGYKQVTAERKQVMRFAGAVRDVDIARESFIYSDLTIPPDLDSFLANERALAEAALRAALAVGLESSFRKRWDEALRLREDDKPWAAGSMAVADSGGQLWASDQTAAANGRRVLPYLIADYCKEGQKLAAEDVKPSRLHALRLRGKHLRYTLEVFRPLYGHRMDVLLASLKETQTALGEVSDCTATIRWLKDKKLIHSNEGQHLRGYLEHRASKSTTQFVDFWHDHWGLPAFRECWIRYLAVYAGRVPPKTQMSSGLDEISAVTG